MDFLFSPLVGLASSLILLPGPVLPDVSGLFAAAPTSVEQRVSEPAQGPSTERLLATPSGYRASGYEALTISPAVSNPSTGR